LQNEPNSYFSPTSSFQNTSTFFSWVRLVKTTSFWKVPCQPSSGAASAVPSRSADPRFSVSLRSQISDLQFPPSLYAVRPMSNNYRPYTTAATPCPAQISILDNQSFLICRVSAPACRHFPGRARWPTAPCSPAVSPCCRGR
jgi:hypothetical protein